MKDTYSKLIAEATRLSSAKQLTDEAISGTCGAALLAANGKIYSGVNLGGVCSISFCGEVGTVLSMLKDGESQIEAIVAISNDHKRMPPCGRCREMMFQVDRRNLKTKILLENDKIVTLEQLFPDRWQELWEEPNANVS